MEQEGFEPQAVMARVGELAGEIRKSNAYPVLVAALAGGVAGGLMAVLIAPRASRRALPKHVEEKIAAVAEKEAERGQGWSAKEIVQLATIGTTLLKEFQVWYQERKLRQNSL